MDEHISGATILKAIEDLRADSREDMRELREAFETFKAEAVEKVTRLETTVKPALVNNGQPSRLTQVENRIADLEKFRWKQSGAAAVCGFVIAFVGELLRKHFNF
jgi:hypothetical protein